MVKGVDVENELQRAADRALEDPILADDSLDHIGFRAPRKLRLPINGTSRTHALRRCIERREIEMAEAVAFVDPLACSFA